MPTLAVWAEVPKFSLLALPLPSFGSQPSEYMTHVGEHLLSLVQQLEPYLHAEQEKEREAASAAAFGSDSGGGSSSSTATAAVDLKRSSSAVAGQEEDTMYWLTLVGHGVVKFALERVTQIPKLSDKGAAQLVTDLEYLAAVLKAIAVPPPPAMDVVLRVLQAPQSQFAALQAPQQLPSEGEQRQLLLTVLNIRKAANNALQPITSVKL